MTNKFFRRTARSEPDVRPGNSFRRQHRHNLTEIVTVLDLPTDPFGIPHVRFAIAFERPDSGRVEAGPRMLALSTFVDSYRDKVA